MSFTRRLLVFFWSGAVITIVVLAFIGPVGWDNQVYWKAIQCVHRDADPYAEGIAAQQIFHERFGFSPHGSPMTYVYSSSTLFLLRLLSFVPGTLLAILYVAALAIGFLLQLWSGWQMATVQERSWLVFLLPAVAFFPGLLNHDVLLSGNIVYLLYGLILAAAVSGWKRNRWRWFYLAVLVASCCKAPLLTLLAFPVLVGRRQWLPAVGTGVAGTLLFFSQLLFWPSLFKEYLLAVQLQFDWNRDFGFGSAGVLGKYLADAGLPYSKAMVVLYLIFAFVLGAILLLTTSRVCKDAINRHTWLPIALVGTILLNPRIKEYDVAAVTIPMLLIAWRVLRMVLDRSASIESGDRPCSISSDSNKSYASTPEKPRLPLIIAASGWFLAANIAANDGSNWQPIELAILLLLFSAGTWMLTERQQKACRQLAMQETA